MIKDFIWNEYCEILEQQKPCSDEEIDEYLRRLKNGESLPEDVHYTVQSGTFYRSAMTDDELRNCLLLKQTRMISTIKSCVVFFTVIAVISLIVSLIASCGLLSM